MDKQHPYTCTKCGLDKVVRIVYGLVAYDYTDKAKNGEVVLGGCEISDDSPRYECLNCGKQYHKKPNNSLK